MPEITIYPTIDGTGNSADGRVARFTGSTSTAETFSQIISGIGTFASVGDVNADGVRLSVTTAGDGFWFMSRSLFSFDTSTIPIGATINSARFSLYITGATTQLGSTKIVLVGADPNTTGNILTTDYGSLDNVLQSDDQPELISISTGAYLHYDLNSVGDDNITRGGVTTFGLTTEWDRVEAFTGVATPSGALQLFFDYRENGTNTSPVFVVDYADPVIIIPINLALDSLSNTLPTSLRSTQGNTLVSSSSSIVNDSMVQGIVNSLISSSTSMVNVAKVEATVSTLIEGATSLIQLAKYIAGGDVSINSVSDLENFLAGTIKGSADISSATNISSDIEKVKIMRTLIESLTNIDFVATRGRTIDTSISAESLVSAFIKNIPANVTVNINASSELRLSFIVPVIVTTLINSSSNLSAEAILGLVKALVDMWDQDSNIICDHLGDAIQVLVSGYTNIRTDIINESELFNTLGWHTLIDMSIDSESNVHFDFARFKRADMSIATGSDLSLDTTSVRKLTTAIISNSDIQTELLNLITGSTVITSVSEIVKDAWVERHLTMELNSESSIDVMSKGLYKMLLDVDSLTDLTSLLSPIRLLSTDINSSTDINLVIKNELTAILGINSESEMIPQLRNIAKGNLSIESNTALLAYLRKIVAPFPTIIVRFVDKSPQEVGGLVGGETGVSFNATVISNP